MRGLKAPAYEAMDDLALANLARRGDGAAGRVVLGRNNQRLHRAAWSILKNRAEAGEAVQDGYLKAFAALDGFNGECAFGAWLTRMVINEALGRRRTAERRRRRLEARGVALLDDYRDVPMESPSAPDAADMTLMGRWMAGLLEGAISRLPEPCRTVFILREVNELTLEDTALALGVSEETVKTRQFRARRRLRDDLGPELKAALTETFQFAGADCAALTERVLEKLEELSSP